MTITKVALTVAAAALATNFFLKNRRGPEFAATEPGEVDMDESLDGAYGTDGTDAAGDADASTAPTAVNVMSATGVPGVGLDSPNDAERLAANGLGTAPQAGISDDPLKSTSQETSDARTPGLPDFFRGA